MVLWVDKYRPRELIKLNLHADVSVRLKKLTESSDFPHVLFYGPAGAGKKTRVNALLRELFGPGTEKLKVQHKSFKIKSRTIEVTTMNSNYHIELNPSDAGMHDRYVVQEVIKEIAQTQAVGAGAQARPFKVVVLNEVDRLTKGAQHALRRTMEKYMASCRLILICESVCRVIPALKSRCLPIRIPAPTHDEIAQILMKIAADERLRLPEALAKRIALESGRNLRRAILMLEACKVDKYPFTDDQKPRVADWQRFIDELGKTMCENQSPQTLQLARHKFYELLGNCIPPEVIFRTLTMCLLKRLDDSLKHEVVRWAAHYEHRMQLGSKPIFHLEAFAAKFMAMYKRWISETFAL